MEDPEKSKRLAALNDELRQRGAGGRIFMTTGVQDQGTQFVDRAIAMMRRFDCFTEDNDPYGEHDFGSFELDGEKLFWKIDYYNNTLDGGSPDPCDPAVTTRVLTLMLASEY